MIELRNRDTRACTHLRADLSPLSGANRKTFAPSEPFSFCEGFRMTAARDDSAGTEAVVRKPPRKEPAGSEARLLPARYGDLIGAMTAAGQLGVPVR